MQVFILALPDQVHQGLPKALTACDEEIRDRGLTLATDGYTNLL